MVNDHDLEASGSKAREISLDYVASLDRLARGVLPASSCKRCLNLGRERTEHDEHSKPGQSDEAEVRGSPTAESSKGSPVRGTFRSTATSNVSADFLVHDQVRHAQLPLCAAGREMGRPTRPASS